MAELDTGDTAWMLASTALVLFMVPGLALFYGGMARSKSVLNMMLMSFGALFVVAILWVLYGYSAAFGELVRWGWSARQHRRGLRPDRGHVGHGARRLGPRVAVRHLPAACSRASPWRSSPARSPTGPGSEPGWSSPGCGPRSCTSLSRTGCSHSTSPTTRAPPRRRLDRQQAGLGQRRQVIDFAGGTAVHINAGAAALALSLVLGPRAGFGSVFRPHNLPLVMLGSGILWFGWYGFNAGSALSAGPTASVVFLNTTVATAAAALAWLVAERVRDGHASTLGAASGTVAGLVAITPSCSAVSPLGAVAIGIAAGVLCALAVGLKHRLGYDDSLDVVGVHLVGGLVGTILIGVVATSAAPAGVDGLLYGGGVAQLAAQTLAAVAVLGYSFVVTLLIAATISRTIGFRLDAADERSGIDRVVHAEAAYEFGNRHRARQRLRRHVAAGTDPCRSRRAGARRPGARGAGARRAGDGLTPVVWLLGRAYRSGRLGWPDARPPPAPRLLPCSRACPTASPRRSRTCAARAACPRPTSPPRCARSGRRCSRRTSRSRSSRSSPAGSASGRSAPRCRRR